MTTEYVSVWNLHIDPTQETQTIPSLKKKGRGESQKIFFLMLIQLYI